ncbi:MAG: type II toxin-antitoxin system PemK/MazF family toxin [Bryobacteraceae bacterium]|nr:type II toxin-antitoxin system PemK/MazF family toxin [Bryobacteraceae bacterium]
MVERLGHGDVVVCVFSGAYGKPRPAVVVQSDAFNETHASVTLCPVTSDITGLSLFRIAVSASETTGLRADSEVMVDKITTVRRSRVGQRVGRLSPASIVSLDAALRNWLELP